MRNWATTSRASRLRDNLHGVFLVNLAEHNHGVVPHLDRLELQRVVDLGDHNSLEVNHAAVCLDLDLLSLSKYRLS